MEVEKTYNSLTSEEEPQANKGYPEQERQSLLREKPPNWSSNSKLSVLDSYTYMYFKD